MSMRSGGRGGLVGRDSQQWGWVAASGFLGIVLGVVALFFPGLAILSAAVLLGIGLIVQGILEITVAMRAGTGATGRGWLLAFGVLTLVAGVLVTFLPGGGILVLAYGLVLWFAVAGVNDLIAAFSTAEHRGWNIGLGILSLLVAFLLLVSPGTAIGTIALFIALSFLFRGGANLGLALTMRRVVR